MKVYLNKNKTHVDPLLHNDILWGLKAHCARTYITACHCTILIQNIQRHIHQFYKSFRKCMQWRDSTVLLCWLHWLRWLPWLCWLADSPVCTASADSADTSDFAEYTDSAYFPVSLLTLLTLLIDFNSKNDSSLLSDCIPYARHYNLRLVYFYPIFEGHFFIWRRFFQKILSLWLA